MIVESRNLYLELERACEDAGLAPGGFVAWIVDAVRPPGTTPIAYLQPAGRLRAETVLVFRAVGGARVEPFEGIAHRLAVWRELPGLPDAALGAMVRHELEHARRWERSGTAFYEADEELRSSIDAAGYAQLPTEQEANAAAREYAQRTLTPLELDDLRAIPEIAALLDADPPADVVGETLALLGRKVKTSGARVTTRAEALVELVPPTF